ncbi:hypothetical protein ACUYFE_01850 [Olegusella massiliensis]|uniref:hypothetical protein n=1 Tax=Olegusella massiliensis TaxID=1776381 RepID=UPI004055554C|nr:hypothetical protein [Coriobacteriaceae bacterium]
MKNMGKLLKRRWREIIIVLLLVVVGILAGLMAKAQKEAQAYVIASKEGFKLTGTYQSHGTPTKYPGAFEGDTQTSVSFSHPDKKTGTITWQANPQDEKQINGTVEATQDPNIYILHRDDGGTDGKAHLAYSFDMGMPNNQSAGLIYIDFGDGKLRPIDKIANIPMTISSDSETEGSAG